MKLDISTPKYPNTYVELDPEDYQRLCKYKYFKKSGGYAVRNTTNDGQRTQIYLHHDIFPKKKGKVVDHLNGNPSDNRRKNLTYCTQKQNLQNRKSQAGSSSKYRGVKKTILRNGEPRYTATLFHNRQNYYLGAYKCESCAAIAVDFKMIDLYDRTPRLNKAPSKCEKGFKNRCRCTLPSKVL